jgi:hypothetical protein
MTTVWKLRAVLYPSLVGAIVFCTVFPEPKLASVLGIVVGYVACKLEGLSKNGKGIDPMSLRETNDKDSDKGSRR